MTCGGVRDQRNGFEIVDYVVWERVDGSVHHVGGERDAEGQRVAVGLRAGDPAGAEVTVRASHVFDDERLAEGAAHALGDDSHDHVRWSARAGRHDDRDRP